MKGKMFPLIYMSKAYVYMQVTVRASFTILKRLRLKNYTFGPCIHGMRDRQEQPNYTIQCRIPCSKCMQYFTNAMQS